MKEIVLTLVIAIVLVIIVVYIFLQGWRATLIPLLAVPVSLVGTFCFFPIFGFSINTLSLFGLVLAIGLVVDDAIVVVEAVERHIEDGLHAEGCGVEGHGRDFRPGRGYRPGSFRGLRPDGIHSRNYRAPLPAVRGDHRDFRDPVCLQRSHAEPGSLGSTAPPQDVPRRTLKRFFDWFNRLFARATDAYVRVCGSLIRKSAIASSLLAAFAVAAAWFGTKVPSSFFRMRTRATSTSIFSFRMPRHCNAPTMWRRKSKTFWPTHPELSIPPASSASACSASCAPVTTASSS